MRRSQSFMLFASTSISILSRIRAQQGTAVSLMERYALPTAICADGSPGFFYMAANASSSNFVFSLMGGGGCAYDEEFCEETREISAPLFTSDGWSDETVGFGLLSGDAADNPLFSESTRVFVPYCTQDFFLLDAVSPSGEFQFRGRPFLEEILTTVLGESADNSTAVLLGSSAGGVGAFNVANWVLDSFEHVTDLNVILDSSFFFDVDGTLAIGLDYLQDNPLAAYDTICSEEFDGGSCCLQFGCMVHRGYYPVEDERLKGTMLLSPSQDALPLFVETAESVTTVDGTQEDKDEDEDITPGDVWDVATYIGRYSSLVQNIASIYPAAISVFAPSCADHILVVSTSAELWMCSPGYEKPTTTDRYDDFVCAFGGDENEDAMAVTYVKTLGDVGLRTKFGYAEEAWENLQIDGTSLRMATEQWWAGRGSASEQVLLFDSCDDLNCNPSCQSDVLPGTRDESDHPLVWTVVLITFMAAIMVLLTGILAVAWGLHEGKQAVALVASALDNRERDPQLQSSKERGARKDDGGNTDDPGARPILEWRRLSYWIQVKKGQASRLQSLPSKRSTAAAAELSPPEKQLLHSVHGSVPEGALCALIGPSGSGKSTLLDLLTGRKDFGRCEGEVLFRGRPIADQPEAYISQSGYMRQVNTGYLDGLTVLENLVYAAMLRFPGTLDAQSRRVETVIEQTSMEKNAHTVARGLSGGQKRRLKIALELLVDRQIFFLDEPSSGLDATASLELVTLLKRLSKKVTIVVAIHQPRPEIWKLFSHAILLSSGRTIYCGPADSALPGTASYLMDKIPTRQSKAGNSQLTPPAEAPGASILTRARGLLPSDAPKEVGPARRRPTLTSRESGLDTTARRFGRVSNILGNRQWDSKYASNNKLTLPRNDVEAQKDPTYLTQAPTEGGSETHDDPSGSTHRSVPDKILDRLMMIDEFAGKLPEGQKEARQDPSGGDEGRNKSTTGAGSQEQRSESLAAPIVSEETIHPAVSTAIYSGDFGIAEKRKIPVLKVAAVLLARSSKAGYAKELISSSAVFLMALTFIVVSLRVATDEAQMLHLVLSVLSGSMLPVFLVYAPVMLVGSHEGWPLTKLEIADGFYTSRSATVRFVIDHFAVAVVLSFAAVGITHVAFWGTFISELPVSATGVDLQLSCGMTLTAWVMLSLFDGLAISKLSFVQAHGISNAVNTIWAVFSGTILTVTSIPAVLKAVTYSSPHYWATFFGLRVLLDGLDLTNSCDYSSIIYCPTSFGDLVAHARDLHVHTTAVSLVCLVAMASVGLASLAAMVHFRGRHARIIDRLGKPPAQ